MINTYLDIQFNSTNLSEIQKVYLCTNKGKVNIGTKALTRTSIQETDGRPNNPPFSFRFSNLCYNYPNRIIISAEDYPVSCEREWYTGMNFNLMSAYHRLAKSLGNSLTPKIDYTTHVYIKEIYRMQLDNGLEMLYFPNIGHNTYKANSSTTLINYKYLLFYPLLFTKKGDKYYCYNPMYGFFDNDTSSGTSTISSYYKSFLLTTHINNNIGVGGGSPSDPSSLACFSMYPVAEGTQIWNIDMEKLNIGLGVNKLSSN